jgi:hypothetical protein
MQETDMITTEEAIQVRWLQNALTTCNELRELDLEELVRLRSLLFRLRDYVASEQPNHLKQTMLEQIDRELCR